MQYNGDKWLLDRDQKGTIFIYQNQSCRIWTSDFGAMMEFLDGKISPNDLITLKGFKDQPVTIGGDAFIKDGLNLED